MFDPVKRGKYAFVLDHRVFKAANYGKCSPCLKAKGQAYILLSLSAESPFTESFGCPMQAAGNQSHIVVPALSKGKSSIDSTTENIYYCTFNFQ